MSSAAEPEAPQQSAAAPAATAAPAAAVPSWQPGDPVPVWAGYAPYPPTRSDRFTSYLQRKWFESPLWLAPTAALVCMAGAIGYTLGTHPASAQPGDAPSCLLKYTTGFVCPGCGGTRAAWYLLHGDIPAAARHHALFVFAVPFLIWMYVAWAGKRVFGWNIPQLTLSPRVLGSFIALWGVWSVLRNLPWAPFTSFYV